MSVVIKIKNNFLKMQNKKHIFELIDILCLYIVLNMQLYFIEIIKNDTKPYKIITLTI